MVYSTYTRRLEDRKEKPQCCSGSHIKCWRHYLKAFKYESSGQKIDEQSLHHNTLSESSLALEIGNNVKFILRWEFTGITIHFDPTFYFLAQLTFYFFDA
jgi:hypothetical protein